MKDTTKLPRLDFAAGLWQHRSLLNAHCPKENFPVSLIFLPAWNWVSVIGEAEDEIPDRTKNLEPGTAN